MFRPVRKKKYEINIEAINALLHNERRGVLAMNGEDGYPYAVPINYVYDEAAQKIYFHGSPEGYKIYALQASDKICFTVYGNETIKKEAWAPFMQSVVIFGKCRLVEAGEMAIALLKKLAMKYYPDEQTVDAAIARAGKFARMFEIEIEHLSGKEVQEK